MATNQPANTTPAESAAEETARLANEERILSGASMDQIRSAGIQNGMQRSEMLRRLAQIGVK
jgi:hypothetical protein